MADSFDVQYALQDAKGRVLPAQRDALSSRQVCAWAVSGCVSP